MQLYAAVKIFVGFIKLAFKNIADQKTRMLFQLKKKKNQGFHFHFYPGGEVNPRSVLFSSYLEIPE